MKPLRACTGKLSSENNNCIFLKTESITITSTIVPRHSSICSIFLNQSVVDQKHERKSSHRDVLFIFQHSEILLLVTFH